MATTHTPASPPPSASLDAEIRRVRSEIATLTRQKSALTSAILSQPTLTARLHAAASDPAQKSRLDALIRAQHAENQTQAQRLFSGASVVRPASADDARALPARFRAWVARPDVLCIRLERYSRASRTFLAPGHVVLEAAGPGQDGGAEAEVRVPVREREVEELLGLSWAVLGHDLPAYVLVEELSERYLSYGGEDAGSRAHQGLRGFVREVQGELMAGLRRHDAIERLRAEMPQGWKEVTANSSDWREVRMEWEDGRMGRVLLDGQGVIEKAVVTDQSGRRDTHSEAELVGKGHIMSLVEGEA